jgi:hypothetical protein
MTSIVCALLTAAGFYFSLGLGEQKPRPRSQPSPTGHRRPSLRDSTPKSTARNVTCSGHSPLVLLRSVENGLPMARSARTGLLTLNDRYGRLVARTKKVGGFTVLVGDLPLQGRGGDTLYDRIGDVFGWICLAAGLGLVSWSFLLRRSRSL